MKSILQILYSTAMEKRDQDYLTMDEFRDFQCALRREEELERELEQLLQDESLRLFKLYVDKKDDESGIASISAFRRGLAMGLKLSAFAMS